MADEAVLGLVADIVTAHVSSNEVASDQLPQMIASVYGALTNLGRAPSPAKEELKPAVPIRSSIKKDSITCLECGRKMTMLKRHLRTEHQLSPDEYRSRWSLARDYPLTAPDYAEQRKQLAENIGLGRKRPAPAKPARAPSKKAQETIQEPVASEAKPKRTRRKAPAAT